MHMLTVYPLSLSGLWWALLTCLRLCQVFWLRGAPYAVMCCHPLPPKVVSHWNGNPSIPRLEINTDMSSAEPVKGRRLSWGWEDAIVLFCCCEKATLVVLEVQQPCLSQKHRKKERCIFQTLYATTTHCSLLSVCMCVAVCLCVCAYFMFGGRGLRGPAMPLYRGSLWWRTSGRDNVWPCFWCYWAALAESWW